MRRCGYGGAVDVRVFIDGTLAGPDDADRVSGARVGHFTAMQVRDGAVRGWDLHTARLDAANREIFGRPLAAADVRGWIRQALGATLDASVRVVAFRDGSGVRVAVTVRPPFLDALTPQALMPVRYQRPAAHLKRVHNPGHNEAIDTAIAAGYADALLVADSGEIAEGGITNIGFWDGAQVTWPSAPALAGITYQLVAPMLPSRHGPVHLDDVPRFRGAFVTNSRGIAAVSRIGSTPVPIDDGLMATVRGAYDAAPWTVI
jgi:branched-subunit amino acid aminotransferase/4-amino-4-deoxychorismate lyase